MILLDPLPYLLGWLFILAVALYAMRRDSWRERAVWCVGLTLGWVFVSLVAYG